MSEQQPSSARTSVAIVGAGLAGLRCARTLLESGLQVTMFDKGRRPGGRMSTRETSVGLFDHGCQLLTATDSRFLAAIEEWHSAQVVTVWNGPLLELDGGTWSQIAPGTVRYKPVAGMQSVIRVLAEGLNVQSGVEICSVEKKTEAWSLADSDGNVVGLFDAVVVAVPPLQAAGLLQSAPRFAEIVRSVPMSPCWTVMVAFSDPIAFSAEAAVVRNSALSWISRSGPGAPGSGSQNSWVLQASPEWSQQYLEASKTAVEEALLHAFFAAIGCAAQSPCYLAAHRWRYAFCTQPLAADCLAHAASGIAVCGDWCSGNNAQGAYLSGLAAAELLRH